MGREITVLFVGHHTIDVDKILHRNEPETDCRQEKCIYVSSSVAATIEFNLTGFSLQFSYFNGNTFILEVKLKAEKSKNDISYTFFRSRIILS